jgi:DNA-binding GntR family transcriptional regulator
MPDTPLLKSKPSSHIAYETLKDLIFSGVLGAGTNHLESELADNLGMSRTPVREAVVMLEAQGLLEVRPRKGVRILPLSPRDMEEIYDVLTELESLAASDAAKRGLSKQELSGLTTAIDAMDKALRADDRNAWAEADDQFHEELVRLGGNSRTVSIVTMMSDQVRRARLATLKMRPEPTQSNEDHRKVLEAIQNNQPDQAHQIHREHRQMSKKIIVDLLEKFELKSI